MAKSSILNRLRLVIVLAAVCLVGQAGEAQRYKTSRTPWRDPDLHRRGRIAHAFGFSAMSVRKHRH